MKRRNIHVPQQLECGCYIPTDLVPQSLCDEAVKLGIKVESLRDLEQEKYGYIVGYWQMEPEGKEWFRHFNSAFTEVEDDGSLPYF